MSIRSRRSRAAGLWLLTASFVLAGIAFAQRGWTHWQQEGFDSGVLLWLLAFLGTLSLTLRYSRQARQASRLNDEASPPPSA